MNWRIRKIENASGTAGTMSAAQVAPELDTGNLAALPADSVYEHFGASIPTSIYDRCWLVQSLGELGRFAEAAEYESEALRLAGTTHQAFTVGLVHFAAGAFHLLKGDWAKARSLIRDCGVPDGEYRPRPARERSPIPPESWRKWVRRARR